MAAFSKFYEVLQTLYCLLPGYAVLSDVAFPRTRKDLAGKIVRARKDDEMGTTRDVPESAYLAAIELVQQNVMPIERQSAEWSVAALEGPFKISTVNLPADAFKRFRIIACCVHLMNFRTQTVGLNQIKSVYVNYGACVQVWVKDMENGY